MMKYYLFVVLLAVLVLPEEGRGQSPVSADVNLLRPGDALRITVWQKPELSGQFVVSADGAIAHPFYKEVRVVGMGIESINNRVHGHLAQFETNPIVLVEPLLQIAVAGEVRRPDVYLFPPETTISQAVMLAGGPTDRGRMRKVRVIRSTGDLVLDLNEPDPTVARTLIQSGDQILMPRERNLFRDYVGPAASVAGLALAIVRIVTLSS